MKAIKNIVPDALLIAGAASVSYGAWIAYEPAGYVVAGVLAIYAALRMI